VKLPLGTLFDNFQPRTLTLRPQTPHPEHFQVWNRHAQHTEHRHYKQRSELCCTSYSKAKMSEEAKYTIGYFSNSRACCYVIVLSSRSSWL